MSPGADRPILGREPLAAVEPMPDRCRDAIGEAHLGCARRLLVERRPRIGLLAALGRHNGPHLDEAGMTDAVNRVADLAQLRREAWRAIMVGEDAVDRVQDRGNRAERQVERDAPPRVRGVRGERREALAHLGELARGRALEAVDRLLLVADGKQRAHALALAESGEELLRQRFDHLPLLGARVLRLVDEDMVDAAVELEQHPGGRIARCAAG